MISDLVMTEKHCTGTIGLAAYSMDSHHTQRIVRDGMAIDRNIAVQDISYTQLRPALVAAGQALGDPVAEPPTSRVAPFHSTLATTTGARFHRMIYQPSSHRFIF